MPLGSSFYSLDSLKSSLSKKHSDLIPISKSPLGVPFAFPAFTHVQLVPHFLQEVLPDCSSDLPVHSPYHSVLFTKVSIISMAPNCILRARAEKIANVC